MRRTRSTLALLAAFAVLAPAGCGADRNTDGGAGTTVVPDPVPSEQAAELIRSCHVSLIETSHAGEVAINLEDGRRISVADPDLEALFAAADEAGDRSCEIEFATE